MPSWHGYSAAPNLQPGTEILLTGGSVVVRVLTGDRITIEMPDSNRLAAVVVDRTGEELMIALHDGKIVKLHMVSDDGFADFRLSEGFSRQSWAVS